MGKSKGGKKPKSGSSGGGGKYGFYHLDLDPNQILFAHSKIKPFFSGCGRLIDDTIQQIRDDRSVLDNIPTITVMEGPRDPDSDKVWYFSLNNRRLYVFKQLRAEGVIDTVRVRVRALKPHEKDRYTLDRCSPTAKFMFKARPKKEGGDEEGQSTSDQEDGSTGAKGKSEEEEVSDQGVEEKLEALMIDRTKSGTVE
eukprot:Clim_evm2s98 gene=Clim_evmTU2s98